MPEDLPPGSLVELNLQLRSGALSSTALVRTCLERITRFNPALNAFIAVCAERALEEAATADRELAAGRCRGLLHGMPIATKDIIDVAGLPTTAASRVRAGHHARRDAVAVARLRAAGAVIVGKTNLHEFALGTTNEDSAFGPARNPYDPTRSPGGSSGGSAAAVAAGLCVAAVGTDTGGSIRIPAAACGIVGLKPAFDEIACKGVVPLSRSLDHVGPLARSVRDAAALYEIMRSGDGGVAPAPAPQPARYRVLGGYFLERLDTDVRERFARTLAQLRNAGAAIDEIELPHAGEIQAIYLHIGLAEAAAYHASALQRRPGDYTPPVRLRLEMGRSILAEDYVRADRGRHVLRGEVDRALETCDALLLPTLAIPAPAIGASAVAVGDATESVRSITLRLTQLFNLTGHPALSLPMGATPSGLPCGLQMVAGRTEELLGLAAACEAQLTGGAGSVGGGTGLMSGQGGGSMSGAGSGRPSGRAGGS
jgi:aspartyl-tRNA(Asn)/glutamyl-tRNA(Gln) amidotransferase subunit A